MALWVLQADQADDQDYCGCHNSNDSAIIMWKNCSPEGQACCLLHAPDNMKMWLATWRFGRSCKIKSLLEPVMGQQTFALQGTTA